MADINELNNAVDEVSGVEPVKKRKGALIGGVTAGVLAVAVGGSAAAYCLSDFVKNQVKLRISKPENYYAWVNEKNASELASQLSESYRLSLEQNKNGQKADVSIKYEMSEDAKNMMLEELFDEDSSDADMIKNFNDIKIGITADEKDTAVSGNVYADMNGERVVSVDVAADMEAMDIFMRIPELTEKWLAVENESIMDPYGADDISDAFENALKDPESMITPEELEQEIEKYVDIYNGCINDVKIEKKETIDISDISVDYTVVSFELTEQKGDEIAAAFINAAKEDEILKRILVEKTEAMTEEEYNSSLDEALESVQHDESYDYSDKIVTISTYIDPSGCIRGFGAESSEEDENARMILGKDGENIRGEFYVGSDVRADLSMTENDEVYSGNLVMTSDGEEVSVEFADLRTVNKDKGYISGTMTLTVLDNDPVSIVFGSDGNSQQVSLDLAVEGTNYGKITLEAAVDGNAEPVIPDKADAYILDENSESIADYVEQEKMTSFIKGILTKLGVSDDEAQELAEAVSDSMYNPYTGDEYDDWDSSFGGWDDDEDFTFDDSDIDDSYDDEIDIDDLDWDDNDFEISGNAVQAEDGQMYVMVIDKDMTSMYIGGAIGESLAYGAKNADITGDGTYTVSVTADTDDYREMFSDIKPNGLYMLCLAADYIEGIDDAEVTLKSVKVDGMSMATKGTPYVECEDGSFAMLIYADGETDDSFENIIGGESIGEWTTIEITFEVKGMK